MAQSDYSALVTQHFHRPSNAGRLEGSNVVEASVGRIDQGAHFRFTADIRDDRIDAIKFEAYGCPHCIAAASWLTERLTGTNLSELQSWSWREVERALEVPAEKRGKLLLLEDAVRQLADRWRRRS